MQKRWLCPKCNVMEVRREGLMCMACYSRSWTQELPPEKALRWKHQLRAEELDRNLRRQGMDRRQRQKALRMITREVRQMDTLPVRSEQSAALQRKGFSPDEIATIKNSLMPGCSDAELKLFLLRCQQSGLNPLKSPPEIWAIPFKKNVGTRDNPRWATVYVTHTSIDGLRVAAFRSRHITGFLGTTSPQWCGEDGQWKDVWLSKQPPAACRVGVYMKGVPEPVYTVVLWSEFESVRKRAGADGGRWAEMPSHMLAIAAERRALRKCCPNLSDLLGDIEAVEAGEAPPSVQQLEAEALPGEVPDAATEEAEAVDTETGEANSPGTHLEAFFSAAKNSGIPSRGAARAWMKREFGTLPEEADEESLEAAIGVLMEATNGT